jgi:hypothetical protein
MTEASSNQRASVARVRHRAVAAAKTARWRNHLQAIDCRSDKPYEIRRSPRSAPWLSVRRRHDVDSGHANSGHRAHRPVPCAPERAAPRLRPSPCARRRSALRACAPAPQRSGAASRRPTTPALCVLEHRTTLIIRRRNRPSPRITPSARSGSCASHARVRAPHTAGFARPRTAAFAAPRTAGFAAPRTAGFAPQPRPGSRSCHGRFALRTRPGSRSAHGRVRAPHTAGFALQPSARGAPPHCRRRGTTWISNR